MFKFKEKKIKKRYIFLALIIVLYIFVYFYSPGLFESSIDRFYNYIKQLLPSLGFMWLLLYVFNLFLDKKSLKGHLEKSVRLKKYGIVILFGIISSGPIYAWYPLLGELKEYGLNNRLIAVFLYTRAVKPALLPLMLTYFSFPFVFVLTIMTIAFALLSGVLVDFAIKGRFKL